MQDPAKPAGKDAAAASSGQALRQRAEDIARKKISLSSKSLQALSPEGMLQTLHELQVHQIELEMQNEELRHAQLQLDTVRARYFDLYDLAPVGYCTVGEQGLILEANIAAATLLGMARSTLVGQRFNRFILKSHQDSFYLYRKQLLASGEQQGCELEMVKSDGSPVWVNLQATTEDNFEVVPVLRIVMSNVTERRLADAERALLNQKLQKNNAGLKRAMVVAEKANRAKSDFLSSMSHELRTPLSAILGFAQLIESGSPPPTLSQKRSVDQILQAGWYLLELINEILDLALVESGKLSLSQEAVPLSEVMQECRSMIEPQGNTRGISVTFPAPKIPYFVSADRTRLKQILVNLLSNAIKYNRVGGTVDVKCIKVSAERIRIDVEDTGEGLTQEKIDQLFQPFNRLGREAYAEEGTGIGLVMTKRLIELMGGTIGVQSTVGKGCTFWIEMDLMTEQPASDAAAQAQAQAQAQVQVQAVADSQIHTLLYVEDNPANLMLIEDLMERRPDVRLLSARDGNNGMMIARTALPDVILMDINLPGISGIEVLKLLTEDPATAHIPVLALSANAIPHDIDKGLKAGFFRYLTKPIKINEFMMTLDEALEFAKSLPGRAAEKEGK
ncbi:PAS domain-containing hybrid sensor histidine kinase/response regulator [Polaromonas sp.]|uniref:hybrid sensor histidine kinase/response regulator n=1 Tax=Polaromonas sp. TaxID=1869339 RepID=UPI0017BDDD7E|nr:PAS domain-containing hybrid sensor histidine kinase/response regulator [Polaromonas sp.]NMM07346.1 response regulator [Polaromonas sp.]